MLRATDRGFVFQLLPKQSWTKAVLEGKQYFFQLQKWQALWLFMSFTVCFVFISILLLERLLETACVGASCGPQRLAECSPPASRAVPSAARAQEQPGPQLNWKIIRGGGEGMGKSHPYCMLRRSHKPLAALNSSGGSAAWREWEIQLSAPSPRDGFSVCFLLEPFPELSFWLASTKAGTAHPGHFGQGSIKN